MDELRKRRAELARRIEVLDRVTVFVDALSAECGIAAEIETDDGDVIVCIPQVVAREPVVVSGGPVREQQEAQAFVAPVGLGETSAPAEPSLPAERAGLTTWEPQEDERLVALFAHGLTRAQVAAALGRPVAATYARLKVLRSRK